MIRPVTEAERRLLAHVSMFGSKGYPLIKLRGGWIWETDGVRGPPKVFKTKRDAIAHFETFLGVLRAALGAAAKERAIAGLRTRGFTEEQIQAETERAEEHEAAKDAHV